MEFPTYDSLPLDPKVQAQEIKEEFDSVEQDAKAAIWHKYCSMENWSKNPELSIEVHKLIAEDFFGIFWMAE